VLVGGSRLPSADAAAAAGPLVSVITSVRDGADTLGETIASVAAQTYRNYEYIVVDGGSTDGTTTVLQEWDAQIDHWLSEPDGGIYEAWNKGLSVVRGEWIAFLGCGDVYTSDALTKYVHCIGDRECEFVSSRVELVSVDTSVVLGVVGREWNWRRFKRYMDVAHVGALHHRRLFERYGQYDASYRIAGDYELLLRPRDTLRTLFLDDVTVRMRVGGRSNNDGRVAREVMRAKVKTGGRSAALSFCEMLRAEAGFRVRRALWARRGGFRAPAGTRAARAGCTSDRSEM
jgi:glycosyltransferase involved in cell wall biosynthesis